MASGGGVRGKVGEHKVRARRASAVRGECLSALFQTVKHGSQRFLQNGEVLLDGVPDDVALDGEIAVHQRIAHANHLAPRE